MSRIETEEKNSADLQVTTLAATQILSSQLLDFTHALWNLADFRLPGTEPLDVVYPPVVALLLSRYNS
jgi:hypothetical protein